jgi:hypothetical protein
MMKGEKKVKAMKVKISKAKLDENSNVIFEQVPNKTGSSLLSNIVKMQERFYPKWANPILGGSKIGVIMENMEKWKEQYEESENEPLKKGQFLDYKDNLEYEIQELKKAIIELSKNNVPKINDEFLNSKTPKEDFEPIKLEDKIKGASQIQLLFELLELPKEELETLKYDNSGVFNYIVSQITGLSDRHTRRIITEKRNDEHKGVLKTKKKNIPKR